MFRSTKRVEDEKLDKRKDRSVLFVFTRKATESTQQNYDTTNRLLTQIDGSGDRRRTESSP